MTVFIRVLGPYTARTHVGTKTFWNVEIFNPDQCDAVDLVPQNESSSLTHNEARAIASHAARVTGLPVREFKVVAKTTLEYVEVDQENT